MQKYKLTIQELVSVWKDQEIVIEANNREEIVESIKKGNLMCDFKVCDYIDSYTFYETEETIEYGYDNIDMEKIEEV